MPCAARSGSASVHPRASGEQIKPIGGRRTRAHRFIPARAGNRSTPHSSIAERAVHRFIPARAGNSQDDRGVRCPDPVHPRACGELRQIALPLKEFDGSSPRERGTQTRFRFLLSVNRRFIPARAGNSSDEILGKSSRPAGSSPRERGTLKKAHFAQHRNRFIPARAGNSLGADPTS